jgi:predicted NodU family carbamoyl transferase
MVLIDRAKDVFEGPLPSPFMLFTHRLRREWLDRIPAAMHVDGLLASRPSIPTVNRWSPGCCAASSAALGRRC